MIQFYGRKDWNWIVDRMEKEIVVAQIVKTLNRRKYNLLMMDKWAQCKKEMSTYLDPITRIGRT